MTTKVAVQLAATPDLRRVSRKSVMPILAGVNYRAD